MYFLKNLNWAFPEKNIVLVLRISIFFEADSIGFRVDLTLRNNGNKCEITRYLMKIFYEPSTKKLREQWEVLVLYIFEIC